MPRERILTVNADDISLQSSNNKVNTHNVGINGNIRIGEDSGLVDSKVRGVRVNKDIMMEKGKQIRYAGASNIERWITYADSNKNLDFSYHSGASNNDTTTGSGSLTNIKSKIAFDGKDDASISYQTATNYSGALISDTTPAQGSSIILFDEDGTQRFKFWVHSDSAGHTLQLSSRDANGDWIGSSIIASVSK